MGIRDWLFLGWLDFRLWMAQRRRLRWPVACPVCQAPVGVGCIPPKEIYLAMRRGGTLYGFEHAERREAR